MPKTYDVVIIGAGVIGCSCAFHLARRGLKVVVVDKGSIGCGGTGRSSAIIRQHYSNELTARMALHSLRVFQGFDDLVGGDVGFTQTGFLAISSHPDLVGLQTNIGLQKGVGIKTELLAPEDLRELFPNLDTRGVAAAAYEPEGGYADPHLTVNAFADAAKRNGAEFILNSAVVSVQFEGDRVSGVQTASETLSAPVVVNCAGPWGARVGKMAGLDLPINSCRVQVAQFVRPQGHEAPHPVVVDFVTGTYFRSEIGNITLAGIIDPSEAEAVVDPDDYDENMDPDFVVTAGQGMMDRYPAMADGKSTGGYSSLYAVTPDWHPIIDEVPSDSGSYVCSGFSGHGFKLAPSVGVMLADLVTKQADPEFSAHLFRAKRYLQKDPVKGAYEYSIAG